MPKPEKLTPEETASLRAEAEETARYYQSRFAPLRARSERAEGQRNLLLLICIVLALLLLGAYTGIDVLSAIFAAGSG